MNDSVFDKIEIDWDSAFKKLPKWGDGFVTVDCDDAGGILDLVIGPDADVHLAVKPHYRARECGHIGVPSIRMRTFAGGGRNHRTRMAMILLMVAIVEDQEEWGNPNED